MKRQGLTTADDFKGQWAQAHKERVELQSGTFKDPSLRQEIAKQVYKEL